MGTDTQRRAGDDGGRGQGDRSPSPGVPGATRAWRRQAGPLPTRAVESSALLTLRVQASGLQSCEGGSLMIHPQKSTLGFPVCPESHRERTQHAASTVTPPKPSQDTDVPHGPLRPHPRLPTSCRDQTQASPNPKPSRMENICDRGLHQSLENKNVMEDSFNRKESLSSLCWTTCQGAAMDGKACRNPERLKRGNFLQQISLLILQLSRSLKGTAGSEITNSR